MTSRVLLLVILTLFVSNHLYSQTINLNIFRGDSKIGYIHASKAITDDSVSYLSESELNFKFIWRYKWKSTVSSILKQESLWQSHLESFLNDKPRDDKHTFYKDEKYYCYDFDEQKEDIKEAIDFTSIMMYFTEPISVPELYSERFQKIVSVEKTGQHTYSIKFPNGDVNHYYYTNKGVLEKVDAERKWFDLVFVPE